jgi:hypothetical protein
VSITLLYGCFQIELCVRDLDAARAFMEGTLAARPIEQQLAWDIAALFPDGGYRVEHLDCGHATFQLNEPSPSLSYQGNRSIHQSYLDRVGPCVTNLNFYVDDIAHAHTLLGEMGAKTLIEGPSSAARSLVDYGPDNTRPGADSRPFLFIGARHLIGLDLEIMEPNFLHFTEQRAQLPCYFRPGQHPDDRLRLERLRVVVEHLASAFDNLVELVTPGSRSKPYAVRAGSLGTAFRIGIGGIEIEYCQPSARNGPLADHLERYGPGVVTAEFTTRDLDVVLEQSPSSESPAATDAVDLLGEQPAHRRAQFPSRELIGFDVVLEDTADTTLITNR